MTVKSRRKLIEVALLLEALNEDTGINCNLPDLVARGSILQMP